MWWTETNRCRWLLVPALVLSSCGSGGDEPGPEGPVAGSGMESSSGSPQERPTVASAEPAELDLGLLQPIHRMDLGFKVRNLTDKPLEILNLKVGCRCVTAKSERDRIPPGETSTVSIVLKPETRGQRKHPVKVVFADGHPALTVFVRYAIVPDLLAKPHLVEFDRLVQLPGATTSVDLILMTQVPAGMEPYIPQGKFAVDVPVTLTFGEMKVKELRAGKRGIELPLRLTLDGSESCPPFRTILRFEGDAFRTLDLPVRGEVLPRWSMEPAAFDLGDMATGESKSATVDLRCNGDARVESVEAPEGAEITHRYLKRREAFRLVLTLTAGEPGTISGTVVVHSTTPDERIQVPVTGEVR